MQANIFRRGRHETGVVVVAVRIEARNVVAMVVDVGGQWYWTDVGRSGIAWRAGLRLVTTLETTLYGPQHPK